LNNFINTFLNYTAKLADNEECLIEILSQRGKLRVEWASTVIE